MKEKSEHDSIGYLIGQYKKELAIFTIGIIFLIAIYTFPIPVIKGLESGKRAALGILFLAAILWITEAIPLYATSLIIVISQIFLIDKATVSADEALAPFFNTIIALFFGGFVLATALHKYNVDNKIAKYMLYHVGKAPKNVMLGMMFVTGFLSMWMSNTATTALMVALAVPIYTQIPKEEKFRKALVLGIPFAANIGGMATPIGTPPNAIIIEALASNGFTLTFLEWMLIAGPITLIMFFFAYLLLFYSFKPSIDKLNIDIDHKTTPGLSRNQKFVLLIFIITVVLWLTSSFEMVGSLFQSSGIVAIVPAIVFFSTGILDKEDLADLNWNVLLLMGGGMSLGNAISSTGLDTWIVGLINQGALGPLLVILAFSGLAITLSTFMSNTATAALMAPIMVVIGMDLNSTISIMASIALACSMAMALPVSTPPNAIAYGTDEIEIKDMIKYGATISAVGLALLTLVFGFGLYYY